MKTHELPTLHDLKEASAATRGKVTVSRLRAAVRSGELQCIRVSDSCSGKILIDADDLAAWLNGMRGKAQVVPSPSEVAAAHKQAEETERQHQ